MATVASTNKQAAASFDRRVAIADLYDAGGWYGSCTSEEMRERVGGSARSIGIALKSLGFTQIGKQKVRRKGKGSRNGGQQAIPVRWEPPAEWSPLFVLQRRLRKMGFSVAAVQRILHSADVPVDILNGAIGNLLANDIPVTKRGALKVAINEAIEEERERYLRRSIPAADVARALRESPYMPTAALLNRIEGLLRAATRNQQV
jgi:hypothetical protein